MAEPKEVGGLHCFEVLAKLSEYVDGTLSAEDRAKVEAHLAACDACTSFGGEFQQVLRALEKLRPPAGSRAG